MQCIKVAGLSVEYKTDFPSVMEGLFADYFVGGQESNVPSLTLDPGPWKKSITERTDQKPETVEFYALSVALGDVLPKYKRLQTHGVAIEFEGKAYIFAAPSGTGKSTRAFLWQKYLGSDKVCVINGDKPILWFKDDTVLACGSPWAGKEGLQKNVCVPIGGLCLLRRSHENKIQRATQKEFLDFYLSQIQLPKAARTIMDSFSLIEELFSKVPAFLLENDLSEQGVKVAFETLTGKEYEHYRI